MPSTKEKSHENILPHYPYHSPIMRLLKQEAAATARFGVSD